ncbi:hypothetical protein RRG08_045140 [Elysia crispata]|uniref:Uncharacterized protein n=1 Tax=Elysia crispata TaxID=231223 RepID=A0AAE1D433_9GAST|nr:hypothetical protein RRG08_045140 [Elysia crispata]
MTRDTMEGEIDRSDEYKLRPFHWPIPLRSSKIWAGLDRDKSAADILAVWLHYGCSMIDNHKMADMVCDQKTAAILAVWLHYGCSMIDNHKMAGMVCDQQLLISCLSGSTMDVQ